MRRDQVGDLPYFVENLLFPRPLYCPSFAPLFTLKGVMSQIEEIITIKPKVKQKGFKGENIQFSQAPLDHNAAFERFKLSMASAEQTKNLAKRDRDLLAVYGQSYEQALSGTPLKPEHYVLGGHELLELDRIPIEHTLRYFLYRYKYSKYPELKILDDYPPCVQIEPSSLCNYRCVMCYQTDRKFFSNQNESMGMMTIDMFRQLIDELEGKVEAITLASRGEPLLNKNFPAMLEYCKGKFLALKVNTNASLLNEKMVHSLLSNEVQTVVFSIDAADKETYEKIRVNGVFEKILRNLELFKNIQTKHYPESRTITRVSGVKINEKQDISQMGEMWADFAEIVAFVNYTPWQNSYDNLENDIVEPCTEFWRRMFIWQDGTVNPCDYDYRSTLSQWKIQNTTVREVWRSKVYEEMRGTHLSGRRSEMSPCNRCINV
jgi:wyosine [tRNA(Phe)-imidazoG37] synthetase (radical SAM superfamily)